MQGSEGSDRQLLDAGALVGHLVPEGGIFAFLAGHRQDLFPDDAFEDLFPSQRGRPSIPASVMASVLVLQTLFDLSDRDTAEAFRCDLRWKVAMGMPLDHKGFDPSTLTYWRQRLAKSGRPHRINDAVRQVVAETGVLRGKGKRAIDSTILSDAVATQDTIIQLISAVRRVGRVVPGGAEAIGRVCSAHDYTKAGKPVMDWDEPGAKDALVSALVNDANALLGEFDGLDLDKADEPVRVALTLLALVAGQDVEPAEGSDGTDGRWRIARRVAPERVISQVDPEARHTRKSPQARRDGYRAHVVAEPETGLITDEAVTKAAGSQNSDAAVAADFLANDLADQARDGGEGSGDGRTWFGDTAYGTGDFRGKVDDAGQEAIIKPHPLKPAVEGGFTRDNFTVDEAAGTVTCPAGNTRTISKKRRVTFGAACRGCPLAARCTTAKAGRTMEFHERDDVLRGAREDWANNPDLREEYRKTRPNVERTVAQVATRGGRRLKLRYIGTEKNNAWIKQRTAGLNLRNLVARNLTRIDGCWVVGTELA